MSDLTLAQLKKAYDAALEQIAAESFLEFGMPPGDFIARLQAGNNPIGSIPNAPDLDGKLRMTLEQAQTFESHYTIIDAYQNDAAGFSAVVLRDTATPNRVVLAVRSTEINNDTARDVGADFQTEGWWSVTPNTCATPIKGPLKSRFVYLYATDIDANDVLKGSVSMCIDRRKFEVFGIADCWRRGLQAVNFAEIDTLSSTDWTAFLDSPR